jgi:hypothetical protein
MNTLVAKVAIRVARFVMPTLFPDMATSEMSPQKAITHRPLRDLLHIG